MLEITRFEGDQEDEIIPSPQVNIDDSEVLDLSTTGSPAEQHRATPDKTKMDIYLGKNPKKLYIEKLRQGSAGNKQDSPASVNSGGSSDIVSPSAVSGISCSSSTEDTGLTSGSTSSSSPLPYQRQLLSPRVIPPFSPAIPAFSPATPDLMDIDLEEFNEISEMTHNWPSPGPFFKGADFGKGAEASKGAESSREADHGVGFRYGKGAKYGELSQEEADAQPIHSSQRPPPKQNKRRGKNLAALSRLQPDDLDFSGPPKEQDDIISSSDAKPSTSSPLAQAQHYLAAIPHPTSPKKSKLETPDKMKTIDSGTLQEIQSSQRSRDSAYLEEASPRELEDLVKSICKTTTDRELSAFVTRALDLSVANQQQCITSAVQDINMDVISSSTTGVSKGRRRLSSTTSVTPSVTSSRVSFKKEEPTHFCQVCGDIAAGFHCGAFVCEACKKFFVRCLKQDNGDKFTCSRNKTCVITKETRTQCQACRFHRCTALGMYKPGTGPMNQMSQDISNIPCKVCGAPSSGYHFGAITCEGCKGFFRRTVKEREGLHYTCNKGGVCAITTATRNVCKACRYNKCLEVGMTPDGSRIGRQPNSVKHRTMMELASIRSDAPETPLPGQVRVKEELPDTHEAQCCSETLPAPELSPPVAATFSPRVKELSPPVPGQHLEHYRGLGLSPEVYQSPSHAVVSSHPPTHPDIPHFEQPAVISPAAIRHTPVAQQQGYRPQQVVHRPDPSECLNYQHLNTAHQPVTVEEYRQNMSRPEPGEPHPPIRQVTTGQTAAGQTVALQPQIPKKEEAAMPVPILCEEVFEMQRALILAHEELSVVTKRAADLLPLRLDATKEEMWDLQMKMFFKCANGVLKFSKKIPGFRKLEMGKQIMIVQMSMYPIVLTKLSTVYDLPNNKYNYFNMESYEETMILQAYPTFSSLLQHLHMIGQSVQRSKLDEFEVSAVCALFMFTTSQEKLMEKKVSAALSAYLKSKYGDGSGDRRQIIEDRLGELDKCNAEHQETVIRIKTENPELEIPQLFEETFFDDC